MPDKSSIFERKEIQIENLKYGLYDQNQNSFLSNSLKKVMKKYEKNQDSKSGILSAYNMLSSFRNNEKELNKNLKLVRKPSTRQNQTYKNPTRIAQNDPGLVNDKETLESLMEKIENLSSKLEYVAKKMSETKPERNNKARVINIEDHKKCNNPTILFMVTSHSANVKRRQTIRNNWGNQERFSAFRTRFNLTYSVFFSVGLGKEKKDIEKTREESRKYHDLVMVNSEEDFYDLTRRVMASFEWAVNHRNFTYLFKLDDDIFINIPNVFAFISNSTIEANKNRLFAGDMNFDAPVSRDPTSKYSATYKEWPVETYPPYCSGGGFFLSRDIIQAIIPYFDWTSPYKIDDVFVGMMVQRAKIENIMLYEPANRYEFWFYGNSSSCEYMTRSMVYHKVDTTQCMESLTMKSVFSIPRAMTIIDYWESKPQSLRSIPSPRLPKWRRYIKPVRNVTKRGGKVNK